MGNASLSIPTGSAKDHAQHHVHFYDGDDTFIYDAVTEFFAEGIPAGQPLVFISTPEHREGIFSRLNSFGYDVQGALANDQITWLDARQTLSQFMVGNMPDAERFGACMGKVLEDSRSGREHLTIRAFGEMVDVLLRDGNPEAAVRLEELWNDLGRRYGFSLLCAYSMGHLYREEHWRYFQRICEQHAKLPDERMDALRAARGVGENGEITYVSGVFKSVCCSAEIVIARGMTFPDCPKHPNLSTIWKKIKDEAR